MNEHDQLTNSAFRTILLGVEEVVGKNGAATILRQAHLAQYVEHYPPNTQERDGHCAEYVTQIAHSLYDIYGPRGARAILQRVGRGQAQAGIAENSAAAGAAQLAMRFLSPRHRAKLGLEVAAHEINTQMGRAALITQDAEFLYFEDIACIYCIGWHSQVAVCHAVTGFVHGIVAWATGGDDFRVDEVECRAKGDPLCRFRIMLLA